ncbi:MAG TPA: RNA methyltransferase [Blastocatellia bacterium]|nr:RNA methyltransferase [Blastocatellia bacterium]
MLSCRVVLVRPRDPNNIGAAARAMKNFGFTDLAVVAPYAPVWTEAVSAVNATDVLTSARVCDTLAEAVADCTLVVGTADRTRVEWKQPLFTPVDLQRELSANSHRLALVFGSEKHGLTNDDLSFCHRVLSLPTAPDCPSMNLGQAVAVCCYELSRDEAGRSAAPVVTAAAGELETSLKLMLEVLQLSGFLLPGNEPVRTRKLRQSLLQAQLSSQEVSFLCGALRQIKSQLEKGTHET